MKSSAKNIVLKSVDDIFQTEENRADAQRERVQEIPLDQLKPFRNHPFKVRDDQRMLDTVDSIREYGVLVPAIARPDPEGGYELISGHRRKRGCEMAGLQTMPVIIRDLDDDAAVLVMVDSNIQREELLPSERAFAYKMKLEALKHQGARSDLTSSQLGTKLRADELLAQQAGESRNQVQRFIRLTELIPELLDIPYCKLYDCGTKRLGCVCCPLGGSAGMQRDLKLFPQFRKFYADAFERMLQARRMSGKKVIPEWDRGESVLLWWMPGGMMRISGVPYSVEVVKKRFHELTSSHIDTLLWSMKRSNREIRNIRSYLLTSLFQAPTTTENIFEADMRCRGLA